MSQTVPAGTPAASRTDSPGWREAVDKDLATLQDNAQAWARLPIPDKIELLHGLGRRTAAAAKRWVELASSAKGLEFDSPLAGEEWTSGPWALLYGVNRLAETLQSLKEHGEVRLRAGAV